MCNGTKCKCIIVTSFLFRPNPDRKNNIQQNTKWCNKRLPATSAEMLRLMTQHNNNKNSLPNNILQ